ncbi:hypothetical protein ACQ4WX_45675 [Streptomyces lasalocidi]
MRRAAPSEAAPERLTARMRVAPWAASQAAVRRPSAPVAPVSRTVPDQSGAGAGGALGRGAFEAAQERARGPYGDLVLAGAA